jgi:hypothetical protein
LEATQFQDEVEADPSFFEPEGHVAVAQDSEPNPSTKRGAGEGSPKMPRFQPADKGPSKQTIFGESKILAMVQAQMNGQVPMSYYSLRGSCFAGINLQEVKAFV